MAMEPGGGLSSGQTASSSGPQPPHVKQGCSRPLALLNMQPRCAKCTVQCQVPWGCQGLQMFPGTRDRKEQVTPTGWWGTLVMALQAPIPCSCLEAHLRGSWWSPGE